MSLVNDSSAGEFGDTEAEALARALAHSRISAIRRLCHANALRQVRANNAAVMRINSDSDSNLGSLAAALHGNTLVCYLNLCPHSNNCCMTDASMDALAAVLPHCNVEDVKSCGDWPGQCTSIGVSKRKWDKIRILCAQNRVHNECLICIIRNEPEAAHRHVHSAWHHRQNVLKPGRRCPQPAWPF